MERLLSMVIRRALRSGLLGGSRSWLAIGGIAWVLRSVRRKPAVVYSEPLDPDHTVQIAHTNESWIQLARREHRQRRDRRKSAASQKPRSSTDR